MNEESLERHGKLLDLLQWATDISGLPITDLSQCQNGALFCIITAMACNIRKDYLSEVNFDARSKAQCKDNFAILKKLARIAGIDGLNLDAKLDSWFRMARSKTDAYWYLKLLRRRLHRLGIHGMESVDEEATAPPAPELRSRQGSSDMTSRQSSIISNASGLSQHRGQGLPVLYTPSDFGYRMPSGSLERELQRHAIYTPSPTSSAESSPRNSGLDFSISPATIQSLLQKSSSLSTGSDLDDSTNQQIVSRTWSMASSMEAFLFPQHPRSPHDCAKTWMEASVPPDQSARQAGAKTLEESPECSPSKYSTDSMDTQEPRLIHQQQKSEYASPKDLGHNLSFEWPQDDELKKVIQDRRPRKNFQTEATSSRVFVRPNRPASTNVREMIKDLDEMITQLDGDKKAKKRSPQTSKTYFSPKDVRDVPNWYAMQTWEDLLDTDAAFYMP